MTTAAIVAAALAAFPAPGCQDAAGRDLRALHYGTAADLEIDAAHGSRARGMGGGSRPCELWVRTGLGANRDVTVFHEAAHTAGYQHGPEMTRAVRRAVLHYRRRLDRPAPNQRHGRGRIGGDGSVSF